MSSKKSDQLLNLVINYLNDAGFKFVNYKIISRDSNNVRIKFPNKQYCDYIISDLKKSDFCNYIVVYYYGDKDVLNFSCL